MRLTDYTHDPFFQPHEFKFFHPSLKKEYTVLQISDLHIMALNENSTPERREIVLNKRERWESVKIGFAKAYGDDYDEPHLLPTTDALPKFIALCNEKMPDAVLFTGDMMEDYSEENLSMLTDAFGELKMPWMWVCGNHEKGFEEQYKPLMQGTPALQTLKVGEITFVGINDANKQVTAEQLAELKAQAENAALPILVMHIPMLTAFNVEETKRFDPYFLLGTGEVTEDTKAFLDYMQTPDNPFAAVLCGHVHGRNDSEYRPGHHQLCASSSMLGPLSVLRFIPAPEPGFEA